MYHNLEIKNELKLLGGKNVNFRIEKGIEENSV